MDGLARHVIIPEIKKMNSPLHIQRKRSSQPTKSPAERILFLQRTIGNQAVQRLIKSGTLQAKLRIGQPGDKYEQEADRVADAVMRMSEPQEAFGDAPHIQRACYMCEEERWQTIEEEELRRQPIEEEEEKELQAKTTSGHIPEVQPDIESYIQSLKGGGQPLSEKDRNFFEPRFVYELGQVRVHTDTQATELARAVNAQAYTVGRDVVFGARQSVRAGDK